MLDTGIVRYFLTGGQPLLVPVNGRPYATTSGDLDTLPLSAIERIELLSGESLGTLGGSAVRGALNVVLRNDLDGFEARAIVRMPSRDGGDGRPGQRLLGRRGRRRAPDPRRGRPQAPGNHLAEPGVQPLRLDRRRCVQRDEGTGSPPRSCTELNPLQVTRETAGNPDLDPSGTERLAIGAEARRGPFFLDVEWYGLSRSGLPGRNSADWAMQNLNECMDEERTNCIRRTAGDITIYDSYANVVDTELSGINTRFGGGFRTGWGVVGLRGAWRRVTSAEMRIAGEEGRYAKG